MSDFNPAQQAKYDLLTSLGLPESQAQASVMTDTNPPVAAAEPTSVYAMLKIKDGANMDELSAALKAYSAAAKASAGKVNGACSIADGEIQLIETYNSPAAMDAHIGNCFPHYVKMLPHADMSEIICVCNPADVDFWTASASAWGASKFIVTPSM